MMSEFVQSSELPYIWITRSHGTDHRSAHMYTYLI